MGILNYLAPAPLRGYQSGDYFRIRVSDSTTFVDSPMTTNIQNSLPIGTGSEGTVVANSDGLNLTIDTAAAPSTTRSLFKTKAWSGPTNHFDFRFRCSHMNMPNGYADGTFAIILGTLFDKDFPSNGGRFYMRIDSPALSKRRVSVIFGMKSNSTDVTVYSRTESFRGEFGSFNIPKTVVGSNAWTEVSPATSPSSRSYANMSFDTFRNVAILQGGLNSIVSGTRIDTWSWDNINKTWTQLTATGPTLWASGACFDSTRQMSLMFGGVVVSSYTNVLYHWDWNSSSWIAFSLPSPVPTIRAGMGMVYLSKHDRVLIFGGTNGTCNNETWIWNPSNNVYTQLSPASNPSNRFFHAMTYDFNRDKVVLFGGTNDGRASRFNDTWEFDYLSNNWTDVTPGSGNPTPRSDLYMYYDSHAKRCIISGGYDGSPTVLKETWAWDGVRWAQLSNLAFGVDGNPMCYDSSTFEGILFGGQLSTFDSSSTFNFSISLTEGNQIEGNVIQSARFARAGNKLLCEWNFYSDQSATCIGLDSSNGLTGAFKNSVQFYPNNGFNITNGLGNIFNDSTGVRASALVRFNSGAGTAGNSDFTGQLTLTRFESVPAVCIDTTHDNTFVDVWGYGGDKVFFNSKARGEGFGDARVTQWLDASIVSSFTSGDLFQFARNEFTTGDNIGFLYDNKLKFCGNNDLKRDIYVNDVIRGNNNGNLNPIISSDLKSGLISNTYGIKVNKEGFLDNILTEDSTDANVINIVKPDRLSNKSYYGQNNLPTYVFYDGTYNFGRDAMFRLVHNLQLTTVSGQSAIPDQYRFYERDTTSYYTVEVVSDGTNFLIYTRIFNLYDHSLSSRSQVNTDYTIFNRNPTYSVNGSNWFPFTSNRLKPNPNLIKFDNKHVMALTLHIPQTISPLDGTSLVILDSKRFFYESEDKGLTWFLRDNFSRNLGTGDEELGGDSNTINVGNNKNMFFNAVLNGAASATIYYHRSDNFARKPILFSNILKISRITSDQTAKFIHSSFDPVQKNVGFAITFANGFTEIIKSPPFPNQSIKNFDSGSRDLLTQLSNQFAPQNKWESAYAIRPFGTVQTGKTLISYDRNGDLIVISPQKNDSTSFMISRTSALKDNLNIMGRFLQCADKTSNRIDRYITEMFTDSFGDIILSTTAMPDTTTVMLGLMKYGQYSTVPNELNHDEGFLYPQKLANAGFHTADSTIPGWLFTNSGGTSIAAISTTGASVTTINRSLSKLDHDNGFKSEWRSFYESANTAVDSTQLRIRFQLAGDFLTSTSLRKVQFAISWTKTFIYISNELVNSSVALAQFNLTPQLLRRYSVYAQPTPDFSCRIVLFGENLNLSNIEKIVWDKYLDVVIPQTSSSVIDDSIQIVANNSLDKLRMEYMWATRNRTPIQFERNTKCFYAGELLATTDFSDFSKFNGIPVQSDVTARFSDGIQVIWNGIDGMLNDSWSFNLDSRTNPKYTISKQPFKVWRSVTDNTSSVIVYDATSQSLTTINADIAAIKNVNFRRCFVEAHSSSLVNSTTVASYSKEIFFDIDTGVISVDATNYGVSSVIPCNGKNWRLSEHKDRFVQFETCRVDGTPYRHLAFKILDNAQDTLTIRSGSNRFDTTAGMRYVIYDPNRCVTLGNNDAGVFGLGYWRIRIPSNQINNPESIGDETAQGSVYLEGYHELGEFDLGLLTKPEGYDDDFELTMQTDIKSTTFENLGVVNFEFARYRKIKKLKYTNDKRETANKLKNMFDYLFGSGKALWLFDDPKNNPISFILCRITSEPQLEELNDGISSISIDLEEIV